MKVCLSGRQKKEYLQKADEIKLEYRDRKVIVDYAKEYPGAKIIIQIPSYVNQEEINWEEIDNYNTICGNKLYLCVASLNVAEIARDLGIKFYCGYAINNDFELQGWINLGASYACIGMPLFFDLPRIKEQYSDSIKFRTVPNVAYTDNLPRENGINGQWIRPEDITLYSRYIDVIEFEEADLKREQALYRLYMEKKEWPGDIRQIITNFGSEGVNRLIPPEVAKRRISCRQVCAAGGACRICFNAVRIANLKKIQKYKEYLEEQTENSEG